MLNDKFKWINHYLLIILSIDHATKPKLYFVSKNGAWDLNNNSFNYLDLCNAIVLSIRRLQLNISVHEGVRAFFGVKCHSSFNNMHVILCFSVIIITALKKLHSYIFLVLL